jgi:hypothetical protein
MMQSHYYKKEDVGKVFMDVQLGDVICPECSLISLDVFKDFDQENKNWRCKNQHL